MQVLKKLTMKIFVLVLPLFIYYFGYNWYKVYTGSFIDDIDGGRIYKAINKSHQKIDSEVIIISDSYGGQLYPIENYKSSEHIFSLSTTAPSSLVGGYILLNNLLENNNLKGKRIIYIVGPGSLKNVLNGSNTYNHFVKPFYTYVNGNYISLNAETKLNNIPYVVISQLPFIKCSDWSPTFERNSSKKIFISDLYIEYINKIIDLGEKEGFSFEIVAPFMREDQMGKSYSELKLQIKENSFSHYFKGYFKNMKFKPIEEFYINSGHYLTPAKYGYNPLGL
jgi:hypothetical protein